MCGNYVRTTVFLHATSDLKPNPTSTQLHDKPNLSNFKHIEGKHDYLTQHNNS